MKRLVCVVLVALAALAADGDLAPLTNAHYGPNGMEEAPVLRSNGRDVLAFWSPTWSGALLVAPLGQTGQTVFPDVSSYGFDAVWTGNGFLVVQGRPAKGMFGRFLDSHGTPLGEEFLISRELVDAKLAASPAGVLAVGRGDDSIRGLLLGDDGRPRGTIAPIVARNADGAASGNGFAVVSFGWENELPAKALRLTLLDRSGGVVAERQLAAESPAWARIAGGDEGYLVVWCRDNVVRSVRIDGHGNAGAAVVLDTRTPASAEVLWNGRGWTVAYRDPRKSSIIVTELDAGGNVVSVDETVVPATSGLSLAPGMVGWRDDVAVAGVVARLPLGTSAPVPVARAFASQNLLAVATSAGGALVVWEDGHGLRAGVLAIDGQWSEHELAPVRPEAAAAASDGRNFMVVSDEGAETRVYRLDATGAPVGTPGVLPPAGKQLAIAWNGSHYGVVVRRNGYVVRPNGTMSAPVPLPFSASDSFSMASDGKGFMVAGELWSCGMAIPCLLHGVYALQLRSNMTPAGEEILRAKHGMGGIETSAALVAVAWLRGEYRVITTFGYATPPSGFAVTDEGYAVAYSGTVRKYDAAGADRGSVSTFNGASPELVTLGGRLIYIDMHHDSGPPAYSAWRIARQTLVDTPPPGAPAVRIEGSGMVSWIPPAGRVDGYRVEWRAGGSAWTELEQWFGPGALQTAIPIPRDAGTIAVRVRAVNEGGVSAYSNEATLTLARRRRTSG